MYVQAPTKSFPNNSALSPFLRVAMIAGFLAVADASTPELGVLEKRTFSTDPVGSVFLRTAEGTIPMVASGAISAQAPVYADAGGMVAASGTLRIGIAMMSATASGDVIEVLRGGENAGIYVIGASTPAAGSSTTDAGVLPAGTSRVYPTTAADGTKGVRVNPADKIAGRMLFIGNDVSNAILKVYPPSGGTINGAAADVAFSSVSGKGVILVCLSSTANTWLAW